MKGAALIRNATMAVFFAYLFIPLGIMAAATFNASSFPTITPWLGTTTHWFAVLFHDAAMGSALWTSVIVGALVVAISVPAGTAAAIVLSNLHARARSIVYAFMVSPLLTPGVIIGISTLVFWGRFGIHGGIVLMVLAQSSFVIAYVMLLVLARLAQFDRTLEEAALDLGASHLQVLRRILLPHLAPALVSAAVLAFLQSFENYNTTLFVRGLENTLTVYIASRVRSGLNPSVNALGLVLIIITVVASLAYEIARRRRVA